MVGCPKLAELLVRRLFAMRAPKASLLFSELFPPTFEIAQHDMISCLILKKNRYITYLEPSKTAGGIDHLGPSYQLDGTF